MPALTGRVRRACGWITDLASDRVFAVHSLRSLLPLKSVESGIELEITLSVECANARKSAYIISGSPPCVWAVGSKQLQEPRMYWRHNLAAVMLDGGFRSQFSGRLLATALGASPGTGSFPPWRTPGRGPLTPALSWWDRANGGRTSALGIASVWRRRVFEITLTDYHLLSFLWSVVSCSLQKTVPARAWAATVIVKRQWGHARK